MHNYHKPTDYVDTVSRLLRARDNNTLLWEVVQSRMSNYTLFVAPGARPYHCSYGEGMFIKVVKRHKWGYCLDEIALTDRNIPELSDHPEVNNYNDNYFFDNYAAARRFEWECYEERKKQTTTITGRFVHSRPTFQELPR